MTPLTYGTDSIIVQGGKIRPYYNIPLPSQFANYVEVFVDFGSMPSTDAVTFVSGQPWVTNTSKVVAQVYGITSDHPSAEEQLIEQLQVTVSEIVFGTGFTLYAHAPLDTFGQYKVHCVGA